MRASKMNYNYRMTLQISSQVSIPVYEIELNFIRAQGAGGQNVNKVSTAVHLRFDIKASSLPHSYKERLLRHKDHHITADGIIVIKAQRFRTQEKNREDALQRLAEIIRQAMVMQKQRKATRPTRGSKLRRMDSKSKRGKQKVMRRKVDY